MSITYDITRDITYEFMRDILNDTYCFLLEYPVYKGLSPRVDGYFENS